MWRLFTFLILCLSLPALAAGELPYTFALSGRLYESPTGQDPLEDANVELRVQILNAAKTCVLYDESQFVSTLASDGSYSVQVGSATGSARRVTGSDPGNTMERIFQNATTVLANCSGSMTTNLPVAAATRYLRMMVKPTGAQSFETLSPEIPLGTVPSAFVAETLGGLSKDQFLRPGSSGNLNQTNLENLFSSTNYPTLTGLLSGSSPSSGGSSAGNYVLTADNGSTNVGEIRFATGTTVKALITNAGDFIANQKIGIGTGAIAPTTDLAFGGDVDRMLGVERSTISNSEGKKLIIEAGGASSSSTDKNGGDLYLSSGIATGTGSSKILFETTSAGVTGSVDRTPTTKMVLDGAGRLGLGTQTPVGNFELLVTGAGHKGFVNRLLADDPFAAQQVFFKSRGTGPLQTGDAIGNIRFAGFDGTNDWSPTVGLAQTTAAQIRAHSAEPWSPTSHGGYLAIATTPKGSTSPADRLVIDSAGNVGLGVGLAPSATLHLRAGRADEFGGPLKFTSGPLLTIPEDGVMEFLTNKLYFSVGTTRYQIPFAENTGNLSSVSSISNATGNISITPQVGGSVTVIGAHSSNSSTGALIIDGGLGVNQNINVGGSVSSTTNYSPQIYGASTSGASIRIDGTDHTNKGNVLLSTAGGNVGIGTSTPTGRLSIDQISNATSGVASAQYITSRAEQSGSASMYGLLIDTSLGSIGSGGYKAIAVNQIGSAFPVNSELFSIGVDGITHFAGYVGIGTSSPTAKLHVSGGDARIGNLTVGHGLSGSNTNTGLGSGILASTTSGYSNTAVGINTLTLTTTGNWNTAIGQFALNQNITGNGNTAIGGALGANVGGSFNVGLGDRNLSANVSGNYNTSGGRQSLFYSTGSSNTAYGVNSATNLTAGDNNLAIGANTNLPNPTGSNQMNIANLLFAIGTTGTSTAPSGSLGVGITEPRSTLDVNGTVRSLAEIHNNFTSEKTFNGAFASGVANQKVQFYWPSNSRIQGEVEITVASGFNDAQASGYVKKRFGLHVSEAGGMYFQDVASEVQGFTRNHMTISDMLWDSTNSRWYFLLANRGSSANNFTIRVRTVINGQNNAVWYNAAAANVSMGAVTSSDSTVYPALYTVIAATNSNVGIGVSAPSYALDVAGTVRAGDYLFTSDQRLKRDIQNLPDALSAVKKLRGVNFRWKDDGRQAIGFIAQEVEKVFPQLVKTDAAGMKSVQYGNFTAILLEAMKEYFSRNDDDKKRLELRLSESEKANEELKKSFEAKIQKLNSRLEALEKKASDL